MHAERLLLGPGPSNPYPEAVEALARPVLGHLDPEYLELVGDTADRLRTVFGTRSRLTLPVSGTGSAGMEACLAGLLEPEDAVIVGVNGYSGERLCEVARRLGARVSAVEAYWAARWSPSGCSTRSGVRRRPGSSRWCTRRRPPACGTTSRRCAPCGTPTRCSCWTP